MNRLTKYEKARIIGVRATQIAEGAEPLIDVKNLIDSVDIATEEFNQKKIPLTVIRTIPYSNEKIEIPLYDKDG